MVKKSYIFFVLSVVAFFVMIQILAMVSVRFEDADWFFALTFHFYAIIALILLPSIILAAFGAYYGFKAYNKQVYNTSFWKSAMVPIVLNIGYLVLFLAPIFMMMLFFEVAAIGMGNVA